MKIKQLLIGVGVFAACSMAYAADLTLSAVNKLDQPVFKAVEWKVTLPNKKIINSQNHMFVIPDAPKGKYSICLNNSCRDKIITEGGLLAIRLQN